MSDQPTKEEQMRHLIDAAIPAGRTTVQQIAAYVTLSEDAAQRLLDEMCAEGELDYVAVSGGRHYQVRRPS